MLLFKFLKGTDYSPSAIENALHKGEIAEVRMDKDYVYIATDIKGLEKEVKLLTSIDINEITEKVFAEYRCLSQISRALEQAHSKIITTAYSKFKKYGLELIDFIIIGEE